MHHPDISVVVLYMKYTGWCINDATARGPGAPLRLELHAPPLQRHNGRRGRGPLPGGCRDTTCPVSSVYQLIVHQVLKQRLPYRYEEKKLVRL